MGFGDVARVIWLVASGQLTSLYSCICIQLQNICILKKKNAENEKVTF